MSFTALTSRYHNSKRGKIEAGISERSLKVKLPRVCCKLGEYSQIATTDSRHGNLSVFSTEHKQRKDIIWEGGYLDSNSGRKHMVNFLKAIVLLADGIS